MESGTIEIESMPHIWSGKTRFWTSKSTVVGAIAKWAVKQSPYPCPENLEKVVAEAYRKFPDPEEYFETDCECLLLAVRDLFERIPEILAWNKSKKGNAEYVFVTRYSEPRPDYDFIDLDALARNIAHDVTLNEIYRISHDKKEGS